jgi:hypothetical protein
VRDPETDCANRSALAALAKQHGVGRDGTLVCEGRYDHVNFIHNPSPFVLKVVEVAPPEPPKLFDLVRHVLGYADLPPILPILERIELKNLVRNMSAPAFLVPCRSGGLDDLGAPVHYLDERPAERHDWTLIGCSAASSSIATIMATSRRASKCARASLLALGVIQRFLNAVFGNLTSNARAKS